MKKMHWKVKELFSRPHIHEGAELGSKPRNNDSSDGKILATMANTSSPVSWTEENCNLPPDAKKLSTSYAPLHLRLNKLSWTH